MTQQKENNQEDKHTSTIADQIVDLIPACPFDLFNFYKENHDLVKKFLHKDTMELDVGDIENVPFDWWYQNREGLLKANIKEKTLTTMQKLEWIKCGIDIIYFTKKYIKIISVDEGLTHFHLYDYQEDLLGMFQKNRFVISMQSRQSGKCVKGDTYINIRNKHTGETKKITIEEFHELQKQKDYSN